MRLNAGGLPPAELQLIGTSPGVGHRQALVGLLADADEVLVSVAFLKAAGLATIKAQLHSCLNRGGIVRFHVGRDFYLTDPEALRWLYSLAQKKQNCTVFLAKSGAATFHPKVYLVRTNGDVAAMVGSANLTGGALTANDEVSLMVRGRAAANIDAELRHWLARLESEARVLPLDRLVLLEYERRWEAYARAQKRAQAEFDDEAPGTIDLQQLRQLYRRYRESSDFRQLQARRAARSAALKLQNSIADFAGTTLTKAASAQVQTHLCDLMGSQKHKHLWHSDAIYRQGSRALRRPADIVRVFDAARRATRWAPARAFDAVKDVALEVPGVGVNMITEILSTFAPKRFPVFNGNTAGALEKLGLERIRSINKTAFSGVLYARVIDSIESVRDHIRATDYVEADAFFNYLYFNERPSDG